MSIGPRSRIMVVPASGCQEVHVVADLGLPPVAIEYRMDSGHLSFHVPFSVMCDRNMNKEKLGDFREAILRAVEKVERPSERLMMAAHYMKALEEGRIDTFKRED